MIKGNWRGNGQFALMINSFVCLQPDGGAQCFPLNCYDDDSDEDTNDLFLSDKNTSIYSVKEGIADNGLNHFLSSYPGLDLTKEDLFYYIYGLPHSSDHQEQFINNLIKELPRIPAVKKYEDFMAFSEAGRKLGDLDLRPKTSSKI